MPPSGYSPQQAESATDFLTSCGDALVREGMADGLSPCQALQREIGNIDRLLSSPEFSQIEHSLFELNRSFYSLLLKGNPATYGALQHAIVAAGDQARTTFLSVESRTAPVLSLQRCTSL
jgi:hypothetical protein